jgi:hypothetical protein
MEKGTHSMYTPTLQRRERTAGGASGSRAKNTKIKEIDEVEFLEKYANGSATKQQHYLYGCDESIF